MLEDGIHCNCNVSLYILHITRITCIFPYLYFPVNACIQRLVNIRPTYGNKPPILDIFPFSLSDLYAINFNGIRRNMLQGERF